MRKTTLQAALRGASARTSSVAHAGRVALLGAMAAAAPLLSSCSDDSSDGKGVDLSQFVGSYEAEIYAFPTGNREATLFEGTTTLTLSQDGKVSATLSGTPVGDVVIKDLQLSPLTWMTDGTKTPSESGSYSYLEGYYFKIPTQSLTIGAYGAISFTWHEDEDFDDSGVYDQDAYKADGEITKKGKFISFRLNATVNAPEGSQLPSVGDIIMAVNGTKK